MGVVAPGKKNPFCYTPYLMIDSCDSFEGLAG